MRDVGHSPFGDYMTLRAPHWVIGLTCFVIVASWVFLNERPEFATQGSFPPGICVERIPEDLLPSAVHRGWPFSFYFSYCVNSSATVQYFAYCVWWDVAVLVGALASTIAVIRYVLRIR